MLNYNPFQVGLPRQQQIKNNINQKKNKKDCFDTLGKHMIWGK